MTTKSYLSQIKRLRVIIEQKKDERRELEANISGLSAVAYDGEKVTTSGSKNAPFVAVVERCMALDDDIERNIVRYIELRKKIVDQIQGLQKTEYIELLHKRYVEDKSLELISVEMHYSFHWIRHMHGRALQEFEKKWGGEYK